MVKAENTQVVVREESKVFVNMEVSGHNYQLHIHRIRYTEAIVVTKVIIGDFRCWYLQEESGAHFISDAPLHNKIKAVILKQLRRLDGTAVYC